MSDAATPPPFDPTKPFTRMLGATANGEFDLSPIGKQYPALQPYLKDVRVQRGMGEGHLEFFPPWEEQNPNPGKMTLEIRDPSLKGDELNKAIAGDMLHMLGATDPRSGKSVDPQWLTLKNDLLSKRSPRSQEIDRREYQREEPQGHRSFEDWMAQSRGDAYIRGYLTPDTADEWRKRGVYTPEMTQTLDKMSQYLKQAPAAPPFDPSKPFTPGASAHPSDPGAETSTAGALWQGLLHGVGNIGYGAARLGAAAVGPAGSADDVGRSAQQRQQVFEQQPTTRQHPTATAIGETVGEMGATAPLGVGRAAAGLWERLLAGAGSGGAGGALGAAATAPPGNRFGPAVGRGAAMGAAAGGAMGGAGGLMRPSALNAPRVSPAALVNAPETQSWRDAARMLTSADVRLSPGQARNIGYKERSLQELPILRGLVRGQVGRSVDDFDRAVVSQALSPLGVAVPRSVAAGHTLMDFGKRQFDQAYGQVLPHLTLAQQPTAGVLQSNPEISNMLSRMSTTDADSFISRIQNDVLGRFDQQGMMDGQTWKLAESALSRQADRISQARPELADALRHTLSVLRDELATQNPTYAPQLQKINHAFSMWARVRDAAERDATGRGRFEPSDLLQVLKGDSSSGSFGRGREPMQAFAEAGQEIIDPSLTNRVPEPTKSAARMLGDIVGGGIGAAPYGLAAGAQQVPGIGRGVGMMAPGVGVEIGKDRKAPRASVGGP